jgi:hypothetical protein
MYIRGKCGVAAQISGVKRHAPGDVVICRVNVEDEVLRYVGIDIPNPHYF